MVRTGHGTVLFRRQKMSRFLRALPLAVLAGALALSTPSPAFATIALYLQEDAGVITQVQTGASFTSINFTGTFGDYTVAVLGANALNGSSLSDLTSSTTTVTQNAGTSGSHTLHLYATETDYTLPTGPNLL